MLDQLKKLQAKFPSIPFDGVAVTAYTYYISPEEQKFNNTLAIGAIHWFLHELITCPTQHLEHSQVDDVLRHKHFEVI